MVIDMIQTAWEIHPVWTVVIGLMILGSAGR